MGKAELHVRVYRGVVPAERYQLLDRSRNLRRHVCSFGRHVQSESEIQLCPVVVDVAVLLLGLVQFEYHLPNDPLQYYSSIAFQLVQFIRWTSTDDL